MERVAGTRGLERSSKGLDTVRDLIADVGGMTAMAPVAEGFALAGEAAEPGTPSWGKGKRGAPRDRREVTAGHADDDRNVVTLPSALGSEGTKGIFLKCDRKKFRVPKRAGLAGGPGFEPRLTGSEPVVLPLNYPPTRAA